jgi:hypothetical protein
MCTLFHGHNGTQESHPNKQPAREFFRNGEALIEGITQHHIAKHQNDHERQANRHDDFETFAVDIKKLVHGLFGSC